MYGVNKESAVPTDAIADVIMNTVFGPIVVGGSYAPPVTKGRKVL